MVNYDVYSHERTVGVGLRFVALAIDGIILSIIGFLITSVFGGIANGGFEMDGISSFLSILLSFLYFWLLEANLGGTLGKLALGLRVTMEDGSPCTLTAAFIRNFMRIVDGFFLYLLGAIFIWNSPTKQRLGDRLAKTYVVKK
ncbi:MAG TPA: RDD family protein [Candidatus Limnocylindrales bacterium]|nr:RDD family protein [Candidatus Limnocylindrales bacterium]